MLVRFNRVSLTRACAVWIILFIACPQLLSQVDESNLAMLMDPRWELASTDYRFVFPRDHGAHDSQRIESWSYTGNLESRDGRRFGYQLTFFRAGLAFKPTNPSRWSIRDLYLAHFSISDVERESFRYFERINRAGVGWAGADAEPYRVWNEDWEARLDGTTHSLAAGDADCSLELNLLPAKPEAIHGESGVVRRGSLPINASHSYSIARLNTSGRLEVSGAVFEVTGLSWMTHDFGTSFLEPEQSGWDRFSIQLSDGRDLMLTRLRRTDGSPDQYSNGSLIGADGKAIPIRFDEFTMSPRQTWRSTESDAAYPTSWRIEVPRFGLRLDVDAGFPNQEFRADESTGVPYWVGGVLVDGDSENVHVDGKGYLEMSGYSRLRMGLIMN